MTNPKPQLLTRARCDVCETTNVKRYDTKTPTGADFSVRYYYCNQCPRDPVTGRRHTFKAIVR